VADGGTTHYRRPPFRGGRAAPERPSRTVLLLTAMIPVIALVGRPNVGKSTLFNRLTRTRDALVADQPGLTRDRKYGDGRMGDRPYLVVDTGGLGGLGQGLEERMARQVWQAVEEADLVLFLVDAKEGMTAADETTAAALRRTGKPVALVVNKTDGRDPHVASAEFHNLGFADAYPVSAAHGRGIERLMDAVLLRLPSPGDGVESSPAVPGIHIALVGRPNVGKSTLVNRMLGEERVLVYDQPGTTRDSIFIPFERDGVAYTLIDTAGVRRRSRVSDKVEKFSVIKTLQAIDAAHVVLLLLDAREGVSEQDTSLAGYIVEKGRALVMVVNKWDGLTPDERRQVRQGLDLRFPFLDYAETFFVSALHGTGVGELYPALQQAYGSAMARLPTPLVSRILEGAVQAHQPPLVRGRRIKLRYAHQGGQNPPVIVVHGNQTERVPDAYRRFLVNTFRRELRLVGTPLRVEFRTTENPFKDRKNVLTARQQQKRRRLYRHARKRS
jgi:GTP-binding protein